MTPESCLNGINHSLAEIDEEIYQIRQRYISYDSAWEADKNMPEMNQLLEQRELVRQMGEVIVHGQS